MSPRRSAVDTSIAVPYLIAKPDAHSAVVAEFDSDELLLAGHARFETYAVITRLPAALRSSAAQAMLAIGSRFAGTVWPDPDRDLLDEISRVGVVGGAVYDGVVGLAAKHHRLTLATQDQRATATYLALGVDVLLVVPDTAG